MLAVDADEVPAVPLMLLELLVVALPVADVEGGVLVEVEILPVVLEVVAAVVSVLAVLEL